MNEMFLQMTGFFVVALLLVTCGGAAAIVHLAFLSSRWRGRADADYLAYIKKWFLRRALPLALLVSFILLLLAIIPASFLAWYRTGTIHQLSTRHLLLRVYDEVAIPNSEDDSVLVERISHSTTNSTEITEFLAAIRFSPTYPNWGCLCSARGGRKFELVRLNGKGVELRPIETFTIHHDESIRFENDWYGDWHLWEKSQADLAAWQQKYIPVSQSSTNDAAGVPAANRKDPSSGQANLATGLPTHPGTEETR
jgi:hypothetical protein